MLKKTHKCHPKWPTEKHCGNFKLQFRKSWSFFSGDDLIIWLQKGRHEKNESIPQELTENQKWRCFELCSTQLTALTTYF